MPTKKKRIGFIPREDVMKIIDRLSIENNLSNSKIISILVEEALSMRGIFNKTNYEETSLYKLVRNDSQVFSEDSSNFKINNEFNKNARSVNHRNLMKKTLLEQTNQENFDLQTYRKFLSFLKFQQMMDEYNS